MNKKTKRTHPLEYIPIGDVNAYGLGSMLSGAMDKMGGVKGIMGGMSGGVLQGASAAVGNALSGGHSSGVGNAMQGLSSIASAIPVYGKFIGPAMNVVGGAINGLFGGPAINEQAMKENNEGNAQLVASAKGSVSSFDDVQGVDNTVKGFQNVAKNSVFGGGASAINEEQRQRREWAENWAQGQEENAVYNLKKKQTNTMMDNYFALGGSFNTHGSDFSTGLTEILNGGSHEENPNEGVQIGTDAEGKPNLVEEGEVIWKDKDYVFSKRLKVTKKMLEDNLLPTAYADKSFAEVAKALSKESEERPVDTISTNTRNEFFARLMSAQESLREKREAKKAKDAYNAMSPEEQTEAMINQTQGEQAQAQEQAQQELTNEQMQGMQAQANMMNGAPMFAEGGFMGNIFAGEGDMPNALQRPNGLAGGIPMTTLATPINPLANQDITGIAPGVASGIPVTQPLNPTPVNPFQGKQIPVPTVDKIPYYSNNAYDKGYLSYLNGLSEKAYTDLYNAQSAEWRKAHANPGYKKAIAWGQDGKGGAFSDMFASAYDKARLSAFTPLKDTRAEGISFMNTTLNPTLPTGEELQKVVPTLDKDTLFGKPINFTPDKRKIADYLRASSILPGVYGLLNPPKAHKMTTSQGRSRDVVFTPSGQQMILNPLDNNFIANQLIAQGRGTANQIANTSGGNRGTALAGLIANGYNTQGALGKAYQQMAEYNNGLHEKTANFYNQRDLSNAQGAMQAMAHNQGQDADFFRRLMQAQEYNGNQEDKVYATKMANLENIFGNMQNIGEDILNREDAKDTAKYLREAITSTNKKACGGKLKRKHRKGLMC